MCFISPIIKRQTHKREREREKDQKLYCIIAKCYPTRMFARMLATALVCLTMIK